MFDDSIGKETNGFEWVNPNEWGQVNVSVLEGDQGEAQLSLDSLKVCSSTKAFSSSGDLLSGACLTTLKYSFKPGSLGAL